MKLSEFLVQLRKAVNEASVALAQKNMDFIKEYFDESSEGGSESSLTPKIVRLDYPVATEQGNVEMRKMDVPLIALVPMSGSKVGKATFSIDFQLEDENGEVMVSFPKKRFGASAHMSHLEISIVPDDVPKGMSKVIENYCDVIEKQTEG